MCFCMISMNGLGQHDELRQSFTSLVPLHTIGSEVKFFRRLSLWAFGVDVEDDFIVVQLHVEHYIGVFVGVVGCWRTVKVAHIIQSVRFPRNSSEMGMILVNEVTKAAEFRAVGSSE